MSIQVVPSQDEKTVKIKVSQQFDYSLHQPFREAYRNVTDSGVIFRLDLSGATYMDSSALGMILLLKEHADKIGGKVIIYKPNDAVHKILTIANFQQFVTIEL